MRSHRSVLLALLLASVLVLAAFLSAMTFGVSLSRPQGGVAFTFTGGYATGTLAADILEDHGIPATFYVASTQLRNGPFYTAYLSASDLRNLSAAGHEIGSMGLDQTDLTTLDAASRLVQLSASRATLEAIVGKPVVQFAYPFGHVDRAVASATAKYYQSGRATSWNVASFAPDVDPMQLPGFVVRKTTTLGEAKWIVDQAIAKDLFIVLSFDRITNTPGTYDWTPDDLRALAAYVASKGVRATTVSTMLATPGSPPGSVVLAAKPGDRHVDLTWAPPASTDAAVTGYTLYRGSSVGMETLYRQLPVAGSFRDVNVTNGVAYSYRLAASNANGQGLASASGIATPAVQPVPTIVFTFDDGSDTHIAAAEKLASKGFRGSFYIISDCKKSEADTARCMSDDEVEELSEAGHDIGSHTVRHRDLVTLKEKYLRSELAKSKASLEKELDRSVEHVAYPYGSHNDEVRAEAANHYSAGRIFLANPEPLSLPLLMAQSGSDPFLVPGIGVMRDTSLARAKAYVDQAILTRTTVVLVFHDLMVSGGDDTTWTPQQFDALVDYVASKGVRVRTMSDIYAS